MKIRMAVICLLFSWGALAQTQVTIYGDDAYPPYSFKDKKGQMTGIYTVILREIFQQMPEFLVSIEGYPWKRGLKEIEQGLIFGLYPPYKRERDRPYMEYDVPILDEELVVVCHEKILHQQRIRWPEDFYGLTVGNNSGFAAGGKPFWQAVERGDIEVEETRGTSKNLQKLIAERVDCYMNDALSIEWELKALMKRGKYNGLSVKKAVVISSEQGYLGFVSDDSRFPFKDKFKARFYSILHEMKGTGRIQKIIDDFIAR